MKFTKVRSRIEDFLVKYKIFLGQINARYGSKQRSHRHLKGFFNALIDLFNDEYPKSFSESEEMVLQKIKKLYPMVNERDSEISKSRKTRFSPESKTYLRIKGELEVAQKCNICGGYLHPLSTDFDHETDIKYGGRSDLENGKPTHYYCNNSKDKLIELGIYKRQ